MMDIKKILATAMTLALFSGGLAIIPTQQANAIGLKCEIKVKCDATFRTVPEPLYPPAPLAQIGNVFRPWDEPKL